MICEWSDYMDDMYPEFAPEPIVIPCQLEAVGYLVIEDTGPPEQRDENHQCMVNVYCVEHLQRTAHTPDDPWTHIVGSGIFGSSLELFPGLP